MACGRMGQLGYRSAGVPVCVWLWEWECGGGERRGVSFEQLGVIDARFVRTLSPARHVFTVVTLD